MMACAADDILNARREVATLADAVADCALVLGTTRGSGYTAYPRTPRDWAPRILGAAQANKVALLFGPRITASRTTI